MIPVHPFPFWAPAALLVLAISAAADFYFYLHVKLRLLARHTLTRTEADARSRELVAEWETLRARVAALESRPVVQEWTPADRVPAALNLNRRGQILRLHGKGRNTAEIAADLQISQGEVELLLKVQDWSATTPL
jgi:hypothetical protein